MKTELNYLIPDCDGVMCAEFPSRELLWDKYCTAACWHVHWGSKTLPFFAIDRTRKFVEGEFLDTYGKAEAAEFLRNTIKQIPYKIPTILTDSGIQLTHKKVDT